MVATHGGVSDHIDKDHEGAGGVDFGDIRMAGAIHGAPTMVAAHGAAFDRIDRSHDGTRAHFCSPAGIKFGMVACAFIYNTYPQSSAR